MDVITYALAKKYVDKTAIALGAVKGAPCTIKSIIETDIEVIVTFEWTGTDGTTQTSTMTIPRGTQGKSLEFNWRGTELGIRLEGDNEYEYVDLQGQSPTATVSKVDNITTITVTDKNGTTTAEIFDGRSDFEKADEKPNREGTVGEIVLNNQPLPGNYIGWVYTLYGWFGFGEIEANDYAAFILSDGSKFTLADGKAFLVQE